jgi:hypothetical protein
MSKTLGQVAYEAYCAADPAMQSSVTGELLPLWEQADPGIKKRWEAAGNAAVVADQMSRSQENKSP